MVYVNIKRTVDIEAIGRSFCKTSYRQCIVEESPFASETKHSVIPSVMLLGNGLRIWRSIMVVFLAAEINSSSSDEIKKIQHEVFGNGIISTPKECHRTCKVGEPPKICYYHFILENYSVLGAACQLCNGTTDFISNDCQCIVADGVERGVLTVNRMIPGPSIQVCQGDKVVVDVENRMSGMETAIHWHGVFQNGFQYYDGVPHLTQCPIAESTSFRYQWVAANAGTHFWHSHAGVQDIDGLYGSLVIRQPPSKDPNSNLYDHDLSSHIVLISDWMHEYGEQRFPGLLKVEGQEPVSLLINGKGRYADPDTGSLTNASLAVFTIKAGQRYRFRLINAFATACPAQISFQDHQMTLIASDGEPLEPVAVDTIVSFSGERYDFVITADQSIDAYWIELRGLGECDRDKRIQNLAILRYEGGPDEPSSAAPTYEDGLDRGILLNPVDAKCNETRDDSICVNQLKSAREVDKGILQEKPDVKIFLPFRYFLYEPEDLFKPNTYKSFLVSIIHVIFMVDGISFTFPPAPPLSQAEDIDPKEFCNSDNMPPDCGEDCRCTHTIDIPLNAIVEVVLVDEAQIEDLWHPFHLHGYAFHVIGIGRAEENITRMDVRHAIEMDKRGLLDRTLDRPPGKDTVGVPQNGYVIFRFRADNPGYWLFHCHFVYHMAAGMQLVFHIGTNTDLPPVPQNFPRCGNFMPPIMPP